MCKVRRLRQHGSSGAASDLKNKAPGRTAALLPYVSTHAWHRGRSSPMRAILPVSLGSAHLAHSRASSTSSCGQGATASSCPPSLAPFPAFNTAEPASSRPTVAVGGFRGWKGRGPSTVDSAPPGAAPTYPDPGQRGNDLSESQGGRIWWGAGFFPRGFPNPPTTCWNFSLWRDLSVWRIWGGYFSRWRLGWGGVY